MQRVFYRILVFCLLCPAVLPTSVRAADPERLSVAYCLDCVPFHFQDENGDPAGMIIDYWRLWSEKTGIKVQFVAAPWDQTLKMVGAGAADAHAGLFFNDERDKFLDYGTALRKTATHVFFHRSIPTTTRFKELAAYRIGVLGGDYVEGFLKERVPGGHIVGYPDYESIVEAIKAGELRVFAVDTPTGLYHLKKAGLLTEFTYVADGPLYRNDWFTAATEGDAETIALINRGMALITEAESREIARQWVGTRRSKTDDALIIAMSRGYPPFTFINAQGEPAGLLVDLWRKWSEKTGRKIRFRPSSWVGTLEGLKSGEADLHAGLSYSADRAKRIRFSRQIYETFSKVYHLIGTEVPARFGDYGTMVLGVSAGSYQAEQIRKLFPGVQVRPFQTTKDMVGALTNFEIAAFIEESQVMDVVLRDMGLQGNIVSRPEHLFVSTIHAGMPLDKEALGAAVNDGLGRLTLGELAGIEARWIVDVDQRFFGRSMTDTDIGLTRRERQWLNAHPVIRLGADRAWPPYEFLNRRGDLDGLSGEFVTRVQDILDIYFQPPESIPWAETVEKVRSRELDILAAIAPTPERRDYMAFSKPYLQWPNVIAARQGGPTIADIEDLTGRKVGVVKGYAIEETLRRERPDLQLVPQRDVASGLDALSRGAIDAFIDSPGAIAHFKAARRLDTVVIAAETPYRFEISFAVRKDWPELVTILDKALAAIRPSERKALFQAANLEEEPTITKMAETPQDLLTAQEGVVIVVVTLAVAAVVIALIMMARTQKRPFFHSLRGKSILFIVGVFVLIGGSTLWVLVYVGDRISTQLGRYIAERHVMWHKEKVLGAIQRELALSEQMAESELLIRWAKEVDDMSLAALARDELQRFHDNFKGETIFLGLKNSGNFYYSDKNSAVVTLNPVETLSRDDPDDGWFFSTMESPAPYNLNVDHNVEIGASNLWVNYALRDKGETLGVVGTGIPLTQFIESFIGTKTRGVTSMMIDANGAIQAHPDPSVIDLDIVTKSLGDTEGVWKLIPNARDRAELKRNMKRLKADAEEAQSVFLRIEGMDGLVALSYLEPMDWYSLAVFEPSALVGVEEAGTLLLVLGFSLIVTVAVFVIGQNLLIIRPINQLSIGARRISEGDYDVHLPVEQHDEIGDLTQTFNGMVATINDYTHNLEQKVGLRTQELQDSEERTRLLLNSVGEGVFGVDLEGRITFVNPQAETLLGYTAEELIGRRAHPLFHHSHPDGSVYPVEDCWMYKSFTYGESYRIDDEVLWRKDQSPLEIEYNSTPIRKGDSIVGAVISFIDISQRKAAERRIIENEAHIRSLFETSNEGIWMIDNDGATTEINQSLSQILGREPDTVVGRYLYEFLDAPSKLVFYQQLEKRKKGMSTSYEVTIERTDGSKVPVVINGTPMYDAAGVKIGSFGMVTDITEVKVKEAQLRDAYEVISGSIDYASNIQKSILPDLSKLDPILKDQFILWEPRDVVGGDIYWCDFWGDGVLMILADCTGHGVPGAFVTLLATGALDKARTEVFKGDLQALITRFHAILQHTLGQHREDGGGADDGLELGACYIDPDMEHLYFLGARFDLFVVEDDEVTTVKGTKKGIGYRGISPTQYYDVHEILLTEGRRFYMSSDGLIDQIGGPRNRGFGKKRFKELLLATRELPMAAQKESILSHLEDYQGDQPRRDDLAVFGFEVR